MNLNKNRILKLLILFSFGLIVSFIVIDMFYFSKLTKDRTLALAISKSKDTNKSFKQLFLSPENILNSIYSSGSFKSYLSNKDKYEQETKDLFLSFVKSEDNIMQLRYINKDGFEKIRVDRKNISDMPYLVDNKKLQNKKERDYFFNKKNQNLEQIWFSKIDLNIENGKVEKPYRSTSRIILPIKNNDTFDGILIINYFMKNKLDEFLESSIFDNILVDSSGKVLRHYDERKNWSFYKNTNFTLFDEFGNLSEKILSKDMFISENFVSNKLSNLTDDEYFIIFKIKEDYLSAQNKQKISEYLIVSLIVFIISYVFSVIFTKIFTNLIEDIKLAKDEALKANKIKSEFLANMSHEIRTPLNGIIGLTNLVLDTKLTRDQKEYLDKSQSSAKALLNIINDVLDYSKMEAGKLNIEEHEFSLDELLENVNDLFGYKLHENNNELIYKIEQSIPNILKGDSLRIMQILNNLVGNAVKFTKNGSIIISITSLEKTKELIRLKFIVEDTGIGISSENQKKLFKAFEQGDSSNTRKYGGTGLGLMICKQIISLMDGDIYVESEEKVGSKFIFTINIKYIPNEEKIDFDNSKFKNKKFLVVDDNDIEREYLRSVLKSWNLSVKTARNGFVAYEMICKESFDYVLLDWKMPKLNGLDLITILSNNKKDLPSILMVTSHKKRDLLKEANNKSIVLEKILEKPFTPSSLYNSIFENNYMKESFSEEIEYTIKTKGKVLLVEDNETNQIVASKILQKYGLSVDIASNGKNAINSVENNKYDIIFMDLQMPEMDGFEATKLIREAGYTTPIIALSAAVMKRDKELTSEAGMNEHIAKPINIKELEDVISRYMEVEKIKKVLKDEALENIKLDGIDIVHTINFLGLEKEDLYKMLVNFANSYKTFEDEINALDFTSEKFKSLIHKLRGVSGNLQINRVFELTSDIENNYDSSDINLKVENLCIATKKVVKSIFEEINPLINEEFTIMSEEKIKDSIDSILYDIENFNYIKKQRVEDIFHSLNNSYDIKDINRIIESFNNNNYEELDIVLRDIKGKISE